MLYGIVYIIILGWLSWEDIKHLRIPIFGLIGLGCICFSEVFFSAERIWTPLLVALGMYLGLWVLNHIAQYFIKSSAMGWGDIWLMGILASRVSPEHIPFFLLFVGLLSWGWGMYWTRGQRNIRFPLVPPISVAFLTLHIMQAT